MAVLNKIFGDKTDDDKLLKENEEEIRRLKDFAVQAEWEGEIDLSMKYYKECIAKNENDFDNWYHRLIQV